MSQDRRIEFDFGKRGKQSLHVNDREAIAQPNAAEETKAAAPAAKSKKAATPKAKGKKKAAPKKAANADATTTAATT